MPVGPATFGTIKRPQGYRPGFYREVRMRFHARVSLLALLAAAIVALTAPAAAQAAFGLETHGFFAGNCKAGFEECGKKAIEKNEEITKEDSEKEGFTTAAGHPPFGVTDFKVTAESAADP